MKTIIPKHTLFHHFSDSESKLSSSLRIKKREPSLTSSSIIRDRHKLIILFLFVLTTFVFSLSEAFAVNVQQEMGASTQRLNTLLSGNVMNVIMGIGIAASVVFAFMKSSLIPLGIGISSGVLYGFAKTWIDAVFTICV